MSKRVHLTDEQAYILAQLLQDKLDDPPITRGQWVYAKFGKTQLNILLNKLVDNSPKD